MKKFLLFLLFPLIAFCNKHIIICYDISRSMKAKPGIERISNYLSFLLFRGIPDIQTQDKVILLKETKFLKKNKPLIELNDRVSFITFGEPPIAPPKISIVYDGGFDFEGFLQGLFPKEEDFTEDWTYLELLYAYAGELSLKYEDLIPIRILISDKGESKLSMDEDEQKKVFWYKENFQEEPILDIQAGNIHLELTKLIPPRSGIEIIEPKPFSTYFKNKELLLKTRVLYQGKPVDKAKVFAIVHDKRKEKIPLSEKNGLYFGTITPSSNALNISFFAYNGIKTFKSESLSLNLVSGKRGYNIPFIIALLLFILWLLKRPYTLYVERMGFGGPPRRIKFKRKNDCIWLSEKANERWIELGFPSGSVVYKKRNKILLYKEGEEEPILIPLNKWFSPKQDVTLRFSKGFPKPGIGESEKKEADFYKL